MCSVGLWNTEEASVAAIEGATGRALGRIRKRQCRARLRFYSERNGVTLEGLTLESGDINCGSIPGKLKKKKKKKEGKRDGGVPPMCSCERVWDRKYNAI